jgi:MHS family alpha-ketoglutarate permease-like MFS transporter
MNRESSARDEHKNAVPPAQGRARLLFGVGAGNAMEWFDWALYTTFAPFFAVQMFHTEDQVSALMATLAVFAVGFVARPFGGLLFGWIADKHGRKLSMSLTLALAALASLIIGLTPTYGAVGALASVILVIARLLQGMAHGGEIPSAQTYLAEAVPKQKRGVWGSLIAFSGTFGQLLGTIIAAAFATIFSQEFMTSWGWRIPFILGGLFGLYALYMRAKLRETEVFIEEKAGGEEQEESSASPADPPPTESIWRTLGRHPRIILQVIGMTGGFTIAYYVWTVAAPSYAIGVKGVPTSSALWASVSALVIFMISLPLWGLLSDRIGRKPVLIVGVLSTAALQTPLHALLSDSAVRLFISMSLMLICAGSFAAILPTVNAEIFPTRIRAIGVGIPYSLAIALFGGTAPYLQTYFTHVGKDFIFDWYVIGMAFVSAAVTLTIRETRGMDLHRDNPEHPRSAQTANSELQPSEVD